jgi:hypothetical protein
VTGDARTGHFNTGVLTATGDWGDNNWPISPAELHNNCSADVDQSSDHSTNALILDATTDRVAQSFIPSGAVTSTVSLWLATSGTFGDTFVIELCADSSGQPGTVLATSDTLTINSTYTDQLLTFAFNSAVDLSASTTYWIMARATAIVGTAHLQLKKSSGGNVYANGAYRESTDSGGSWSGTDATDLAFKVWQGARMQWFTPQLTAFTLGDLIEVNLRMLQSNVDHGAAAVCEVAVVNADGSSPTVFGIAGFTAVYTDGGRLTTSEAAYNFKISGDDTAVTEGQRLRIRVFAGGYSVFYANLGDGNDDTWIGPDAAQATDHSYSLVYNGTSGGATGDSYVRFSQSITEAAGTTLVLSQGFVVRQRCLVTRLGRKLPPMCTGRLGIATIRVRHKVSPADGLWGLLATTMYSRISAVRIMAVNHSDATRNR